MQTTKFSRRSFGLMAGGLALGITEKLVAHPASPKTWFDSTTESSNKIPLGFDNFSIRALKWNADQLLDFAAEQNLDTVLFSDLDVYKNHSKQYLSSLSDKAADLGVTIQAGTGGICPTSTKFNKKWGTAVEHLELCIQVAANVGSDVVRCYLGAQKDREGMGGIRRHMDSTVETLKKVRKQAKDAGIKFAVENHAGDMQAFELVELIKAAGEDFVGATIDSGNATWTLENPLDNLEVLGPYALSSGMRDSTVWMDEEGAKVAWNAVGEGQVDWDLYLARFAELCPNVPFQLEIISGFNRAFPFKKKDFWQIFPEARAKEFESFLSMARQGKPVPKGKSNDPEFQMSELKRSIRFCKEKLGMGLKS